MSATTERWRQAAVLLQLEEQPVLRAAGRWLADVAEAVALREPHQSAADHTVLLGTGDRLHAAAITDAYLHTTTTERTA